MSKYQITVTTADGTPVAIPVVEEVMDGLGDVTEVSIPYRPLSPEEIRHFQNVFSQVDAILVRAGFFTRPLLESAKRLKIIAIHGAGVDQVDVSVATELGIMVSNTPGVNANAVAELTLGLIIGLLREIPQADHRVRTHVQWREARPAMAWEFRGKTLGLVGLGAVGRRVADLARAFEARVIAYDPYIASGVVPPSVQMVDFDMLLQASDVISVHVPFTPETRGMLSSDAFSRVKRGVFLVNTSRGAIVDEEALQQALESGWVRGAALDVLKDEPPTSRRPIFDHPSVIITPHMGASTVEVLERVAKVAAEDIARALRGEKVLHLVNPEVRPRD
jgi:D-3-phosphoglycerate dehydrogenase